MLGLEDLEFNTFTILTKLNNVNMNVFGITRTGLSPVHNN